MEPTQGHFKVNGWNAVRIEWFANVQRMQNLADTRVENVLVEKKEAGDVGKWVKWNWGKPGSKNECLLVWFTYKITRGITCEEEIDRAEIAGECYIWGPKWSATVGG